ncbi:MAG: ABC transporter ATP-binding protein [Hyphomicrobiaceae bacterium]
MSALRMRQVSVRLAAREILRSVDVDIEPGQVVGVIGPNGAGKSTLLRAALGLVPASGQITLFGKPMPVMSEEARARLAAYVPQDRKVAWPLTIEAVIALGRLPHLAPMTPMSSRDRAIVDEIIREVELDDLRGRRINEISGGEKARVLIARAFAQDTPLLLADEPGAGLDPAHQISLLELFRAKARKGRSVVVTMHDLTAAARWCDSLVLLHHGAVVASGPPLSVLSVERIAQVYACKALIAQDEAGPIVMTTARIGDSGSSDTRPTEEQ